MTPEQRSLRARIAAHARWSRTPDGVAATDSARTAAEDRFAQQVDPDGVLAPATRARMAANARTAFYLRLSAAGNKAQAKRRLGRAS